MSVTNVLRIVAVVGMGLVFAQSLRLVLMSLAGHRRLGARDMLSEVLTGIGAFAIGYGLLPSGSQAPDNTLFLGGLIVWIAGAMAASPARPAGNS